MSRRLTLALLPIRRVCPQARRGTRGHVLHGAAPPAGPPECSEAPRSWADLLLVDKELGLRWSIELIKRGVLVNPNEKFYVSLAHTDADIDRTLEVVDEAFAAIA